MTDSECLFCKIASKHLPANMVFEDDQVVVIEDINPASPVHLLIIPKHHITSLDAISDDDLALLGHIQVVASHLAREKSIASQGYRLVNNCGLWGGQSVAHLHYHLLGGREMGWPPG